MDGRQLKHTPTTKLKPYLCTLKELGHYTYQDQETTVRLANHVPHALKLNLNPEPLIKNRNQISRQFNKSISTSSSHIRQMQTSQTLNEE